MTALFCKSILYCYILLGPFLGSKPEYDSFHPLHVSTADVSFNNQDGHLEVIFTIFTDDFESALEKQFHSKSDLSKPDMHAAMDVMVKNYLTDHFQLKADNTLLPLSYVGFEINREAVNVYIESGKIASPKKIEAYDSILHNLFNDQLNIVHMTVSGTRKSAKLDYPATRITQVF
ncbi:DUF6702 family protein [Mucilaginibacter segetis]|uniref:Uncharacterized protein n=1 Tax=Mucilaginibacter segetis TaxID=2793071 RepID=A0A934PTV8_9SPHI|nr:DUF6702 family protein [Mucilaginibacter segetis]MBK0378913.1 hypothetical protein [Mucilaginibacter segetis]